MLTFLRPPRVLSLALCALVVSACGDDGDADAAPPVDPEAVDRGLTLYEQPLEDGNTFACATCHALEDGDGVRRAGHPIGGATARDSFKNGQIDTFGEAVNSCLTEWMNADAWTPDDPRLADLEAFISTEAGGEDEISYEIVQPPADLDGGDASRGQQLFNASCIECHGPDGEGTQRAIAVDSGVLDPSYVARRVRTSGRSTSAVYDGLTGGVMPFWAADRLTDEELLDLVAFLSADFDPDAEPDPEPEPDPDPDPDPDPTGDPDPDPDPDPTGEPSDCGAGHPMVGQTAQLQNFFHDVGGTAEIIDNCTIEVREFSFDGQGIDVQIYGGFEGAYDDGFSMSENLVRDMPYNGETMRFTIPEGMSLDDLGGISVWCVPVGADFGSGTFG